MTARNFGMSGQQRLRGMSTSLSAYGATKYERADSIQFATASPPDASWPNSEGSNLPLFISAGPPLERSKIAQALIDVAAVLTALLLISVTSLSIVVAFAILFFVRVG